MDTLGLALIVGGAAFVCSGLVFLFPSERRASELEKSVQENLDEVDGYLQRMRRERSDLS
jgi:hypothetical protein